MNNLNQIQNPYLPRIASIEKITQETGDIKTFRLVFLEGDFHHLPGQFVELSVFGRGEAPISISSFIPGENSLELSVKKMGKVTSYLHSMCEGDKVGLRGPYGNTFPVERIKGQNLLFIGGGIGLAPLRSLIHYSFLKRDDFGKISIIYGARTPADLVFKEELFNIWSNIKNTEVHITVDVATNSWQGKVGVVPKILKELNPSPDNTVAFTCGPPIMIKYSLEALNDLNFPEEDTVTTLEMKMKCGIGKCGRCNIGNKYICLDGPVFTLKELKNLPKEY
ncbi:MAG: Anaerobic sulfite reductase subunit B [candidate division WS2 bacterium]|uniref:Anaerobic sulfite reductase subunit B n=1 Tax=Psychracetigena formicireducens TaxID=2986056 RepID=A0A9E2BGD0_PSYF1|nr:Anaerobic sulfite reductase subunit B [Candidatus Psychracetigena formicireducens]